MTKNDSTYERYVRIEKFLRQRPSLIDLIKKLLLASYGAEDERVQLGLSKIDSRHLLPLGDVKAQLSMRSAVMNIKNGKRNGLFSTEIFHYAVVVFQNYLQIIQKDRAVK